MKRSPIGSDIKVLTNRLTDTYPVTFILFSTYETVTDKNQNYPSDVTNLNSNCRDSIGLFSVDRFWRIETENYTTKPTPIISFGYDNSPNEIGGTNTIVENKLNKLDQSGIASRLRAKL